MGDLPAFIELGFRHIVSVGAADHILFLLVLAAIYRPRDWRAVLWVVTAFTLGHSLTLGLAVTGRLALPGAWVEFLIPVTIVATGVENLLLRERALAGRGARHRPVIALLFGLVHGAGFAGYLRGLLVDDVATPLLGFNIGVELGQLTVLAATAVLFVAADRGLERLRDLLRFRTAPFLLRLTAVSTLVTAVAAFWTWERLP